MLKKVAVFISGGGSNFASIADYKQNSYQIKLVISDNSQAKGLEKASLRGIENIYIGKKNFPNANDRDEKILKVLAEKEIDIIVLAGYLSIVSAKIVEKYPNKIINIHPSLIPEFCGKGFYGSRVHEAVFQAKAKKSGATVHFVDEGVDTGKIIMQESVEILESDDAVSIASKVLKIEHKILPIALETICIDASK